MTPEQRMRKASLEAILEIILALYRDQLQMRPAEWRQHDLDSLAWKLRASMRELAKPLPEPDRTQLQQAFEEVSQRVQARLAEEPDQEELNRLGRKWTARTGQKPPTPD